MCKRIYTHDINYYHIRYIHKVWLKSTYKFSYRRKIKVELIMINSEDVTYSLLRILQLNCYFSPIPQCNLHKSRSLMCS